MGLSADSLPYEWQAQIRLLCDCHILKAVDPSQIPDLQKGDVLIFCSDADRSYDKLTQHFRFHLAHRNQPRSHLIALAGGALSILFDPQENGRVILKNITLTLRKIKTDIHCISLYAHTPCGMYTLPPKEGVLALLKSRDRLMCHLAEQGLSAVQIYCFYHVDYGPDQPDGKPFRTYQVDGCNSKIFPEFFPPPTIIIGRRKSID